MLGKEHDRDQPGCSSDGFEDANSAGLVGEAAGDEHGDTRDSKKREEPASDQQRESLVADQAAIDGFDVLPRPNAGRSLISRCVRAFEC
ncbi:MAG TPA: hypothetical protein VGN29_21355 [Solirubrobacteraceae bacterium]|nr:hypothetical protein [Solirubrobacteraceae bacterium]